MSNSVKYKAIIFDLDGVLCTTDMYHYEAWKKIADEENIYFDQEINNRLRGVSRMESLDIILERASKDYTLEEKEVLATRKNEIYKNLLSGLSPDCLANDIVSTLQNLEKDYDLAIGSSSKNTMLIVEKLGIKDFFKVIVDGTMIERSKPDPEVFLKCAERLGIPVDECIVIEDAPSGILSAQRGGFDTSAIGEAQRCDGVNYKISSISDLIDILKD